MFSEEPAQYKQRDQLYSRREDQANSIRQSDRQNMLLAKRLEMMAGKNPILQLPYLIKCRETKWIEELLEYLTFVDTLPDKAELKQEWFIAEYESVKGDSTVAEQEFELAVFKSLNRLKIWEKDQGVNGWWVDQAFAYMDGGLDISREINFYLYHNSKDEESDTLKEKSESRWFNTTQDPRGQAKVDIFMKALHKVENLSDTNKLQQHIQILRCLLDAMTPQVRELSIQFLSHCLNFKQLQVNSLQLLERYCSNSQCQLIFNLDNFKSIVGFMTDPQIYRKFASTEIVLNVIAADSTGNICEQLNDKYQVVNIFAELLKHTFQHLRPRIYWGLSNIANFDRLIKLVLPLLHQVEEWYQQGVVDKLAYEAQILVLNAFQSTKEDIEWILTQHPKCLNILLDSIRSCWLEEGVTEMALNAVLFCSSKSDVFRKTIASHNIKSLALELFEHKNQTISKAADHFLNCFEDICKKN